MPEPILAMEAVSLRSPDGPVVFQDLDWLVPRGECHHVRGVGASALLRLCAGVALPDQGRVLLDGVPLDGGRHPLLERGEVGWVPSDGGLTVNQTLLDNIALPLRFARNIERQQARDQAMALLERCGLGECALQRPRVPGDGQSWLVGLLRAAARSPELWLVDRPGGGLDSRSLHAAQGILETALADPAMTLVVVGGDWLAPYGQPLIIEDGRLASRREP
jgi:ABC-type transporter Mla maintaining outer membrane lipid asymmetry ATPase subunit MlaF